MIDEGVIKYHCLRTAAAPPANECIAVLEQWRSRLWQRGWIGFDVSHQVGYGNLSVRDPRSREIWISGTQTGHLATLTPAHYCRVDRWDIAGNTVWCSGALDASSETLTHAALYANDASVHAVFHVHDDSEWQRLSGHLPETDAAVAYGTPAMAQELQRLSGQAEAAAAGVVRMAGHPGGFLSWGGDPDAAGTALLRSLNGPPGT